MRTYRRQRKQFLFAGLLAEGETRLAEPVRTRDHGELALRAFGAAVEREGKQVKIRGGQRLDPISAVIPGDISSANLEQDRQRLFSMHFIPRNAGWSEILVRLDAMVREAEVQNTHKDYGIDQAPQYGLYSVKIRIPVVGAYPEVVNFIKDLEDSETFFIIDSIDLHGTDSPASESSDISLGLNVETFFYQ